MNPKLEEARMQIASEIGADIGYFTPAGEKRFTGIELMLFIGGAFLFGFLKGLAGKAGEKVGEHLGEELGEYISGKIDELRGKDRPTQDQLLEDARREAEQKIIRAGLTPEQVKSIALAVEAELARALEATAPKDVSSRIAHKVFAESLQAV